MYIVCIYLFFYIFKYAFNEKCAKDMDACNLKEKLRRTYEIWNSFALSLKVTYSILKHLFNVFVSGKSCQLEFKFVFFFNSTSKN